MPTASIVVPLYGQWPLTEACLRSLAVSTLDVPDLEVLAVDNGAAAFPAESAACAALGRALPRCEAGAAAPVPRAALAALVNEEPWLPRVWDRLITAEADPETALGLARRAALFDLSPAPWLRMRDLARRLGRTDAWRQTQNALESYLLPREERLRPALRVRCPELADEANRVLALEPAFQRDEYLPFERQVLYKEGQ